LKKTDKYKVVSLFTGAGGLDIGFEEFNIITSREILEHTKGVYPDVIIGGGLSDTKN
jgi:site-specific DNA-cytosine methylase